MNLLQQLDEIEPRWRQIYGTDPMEVAYELGLIDDPDDSYVEDVPEVDLIDEQAAWRRYSRSYEDVE